MKLSGNENSRKFIKLLCKVNSEEKEQTNFKNKIIEEQSIEVNQETSSISETHYVMMRVALGFKYRASEFNGNPCTVKHELIISEREAKLLDAIKGNTHYTTAISDMYDIIKRQIMTVKEHGIGNPECEAIYNKLDIELAELIIGIRCDIEDDCCNKELIKKYLIPRIETTDSGVKVKNPTDIIYVSAVYDSTGLTKKAEPTHEF